MKRTILFIFLAGLTLLGSGAPARSDETRSVYVGDIVTLRITAPDITADTLADSFAPFEILEQTDTPGGYLLSLRTFQTGEHRIRLGNTDLLIHVRSALDEMPREDLWEGDTGVAGPDRLFPWHLLFYGSAGVFILALGLPLLRARRKRTRKAPNALQGFLQRSGMLSPEDTRYLVEITYCFKKYLESLLGRRIIGKTSAEITAELTGVPLFECMLPDIRAWLTECDRIKFTGVSAGTDEKRRLYETLVHLVTGIDMQKEGAV
jgi:hypothetical protein